MSVPAKGHARQGLERLEFSAGLLRAEARAVTGAEGGGAQAGLRPFERLTKASVEGLRYRAEDIARSLTKSAIKEVGPDAILLPVITGLQICRGLPDPVSHPEGEWRYQ